jgi:hypothetical protein
MHDDRREIVRRRIATRLMPYHGNGICFRPFMLCEDCNTMDGSRKSRLKIRLIGNPEYSSFKYSEMKMFFQLKSRFVGQNMILDKLWIKMTNNIIKDQAKKIARIFPIVKYEMARND